MDLTGPATRLEVPTLILVGSQDRLTTPALAQHLSELIPGSLLRITKVLATCCCWKYPNG